MKRWLITLIALFGLAFLIAWRLQQKKASDVAQSQQKRARPAPLVSVASASVKDIVHTFEAVGSVEAPLSVHISPKVTGRIEAITVHEGDPVKKGQLLVQVDPTQIEAQVAQGQADLAAAQSRLAQAQITANPTNVGVATQVRQQQAALASETAVYNQVRQNYASQVAAAQAEVNDAQSKVNSANAQIANADASIQSAQANLNNATAKYNRYANLYKQGFVSAQDLDDNRTAVDVQKGALAVARGQLGTAQAGLASAQSQLKSAQEQAEIVKRTGQADIEAERAKVVQAKAALAYAKANTAQRPAYQQNIAALRAAVESAAASLRITQSQLADARLVSPIDGFVTGRFMDPGAVATAGQQILTVQEISAVWVSIAVPEEVSRKIYVGQPARITLDALPGKSFNGKVTQYNPSADPTSRQFTARIALANPQRLLKPGMFAHVSIVTERVTGATVVPREAVQQSSQGSTVTVVTAGGVAQVRSVQVGTSDASDIAIVEGVEPGEKVITLSADPVKNGQKVRLNAGGRGGKRKAQASLYQKAGVGRIS
jgi:RND family efflux transporter MFP subunit